MQNIFTIHPDMSDLIAAKEALTKTNDSGVVRSEWDNYGARLSRPYPKDMDVRDMSVACSGAGRDGTVPVRIYRPAEAKDGVAPCVLFLHGGGFIKGSLESADANAWGVAQETGAVVVSVDYRLAPDFPYPAALMDTYGVLEYIKANASSLGINPDKISVWGESAGGNLAAATCLMSRDRKGPQICAQVVIYPCLTNDLSSQSYSVHGDSVGLTTKFVAHCWDMYLGGQKPDPESYATPLKQKNLAGLPPAFIHYAQIDPIADDGPQYAEQLRAAGGSATLRCATGMIHGFIRARFSGTTAEREFSLPCTFLRGVFAAVSGVSGKALSPA
jgi:acetyl esterase